jgi:peptide/nickel transport system ATP-binding protein
MIFQDPFGSLNPMRTVRQHLWPIVSAEDGATNAMVLERVLALLASVGLDPPRDFIDRHPHALSGGQRQRVAIARALASNPTVIVADEPTSMLDLTLRRGILSLLDRLRHERGVACLLITHDLQSAGLLADRVAVMHRGRIVENRPAADLFEAPEHPYTQALFSASAATTLVPTPLEHRP